MPAKWPLNLSKGLCRTHECDYVTQTDRPRYKKCIGICRIVCAVRAILSKMKEKTALWRRRRKEVNEDDENENVNVMD